MLLKTIVMLASLFVFSLNPSAEGFRVIVWNVESDRPDHNTNSDTNDPAVIAREIQQLPLYDIWGLSEVREENAVRYVQAMQAGEGIRFDHKLSQSGMTDRLLLAYSQQKFELVDGEIEELRTLAIPGTDTTPFDSGSRAPLAAKLKLKSTGDVFYFVLVHLTRGNADRRMDQAIALREWGREQSIPVIAAGDFNFDFEIPTMSGNESFDAFRRDGIFQWVQPQILLPTQFSVNSSGEVYLRYNSILDFIFVSNKAKDWHKESRVLVRQYDYRGNDSKRSDHRPVVGMFMVD